MGEETHAVRTAQEVRTITENRTELQTAQFQQQTTQLEEEQQQEEQREQQAYDDLLHRFSRLPDDIPVASGNAPASRLSRKKRRREEKRQEAALEKEWQDYKSLAGSTQLLSAVQVRDMKLFSSQKGRQKWSSTKLKHSKLTLGETVDQVRAGDYSNFENLDGVMRNLTAGRVLRQLMQDYDLMGTEPKALCRQLMQNGGVSALLDPALRLGLSLAQHTDKFMNQDITVEMKTRFRELDETMSAMVMQETLTHQASLDAVRQSIRPQTSGPAEEQAGEAARRAVAANEAQQIQIAKRLLLMHLGNLQKVPEEGEPQDWDRPVAVALSHCSRVALTLPKLRSNTAEDKAEYQRMWRSIFYQKDGSNPAEDNWRASSTHSIQRRKVNGADTKEKKVLFNFIGQRGMNVAIGGLGNAGISRQTLRNDGSCGHFYSMYKEGDTTHYGAMLMGLESDCAGVTNQMGHTHDIKATAEKASSLGGQRSDEVGKKYGGRTCDLSTLSAGEISGYMEMLEDAMKYWQSQPGGLSGAEPAAMMEKLVGGRMSFDAFRQQMLPVLNRAAQAFRG